MASAGQDFLDYLNASPSAFHAVASSIQRLEKAGFTRLRERDPWTSVLRAGGRYYVTRNESSIVAFAIGPAWEPGNPVALIGAHSDSPCLKVKPVAQRSADGYMQVGVELYGSGMWHTWFDRDLSIAGRAIVKTSSGKIEQRLVRIARPIMRIPNLAVHFDPIERGDKLEYNTQTHLHPITGLVSAELNRTGKTEEEDRGEQHSAPSGARPLKKIMQRQYPYLLSLVADEANCTVGEICDFELVLYDTQPAGIAGLNDELVSAARLDNLAMTYCAMQGLIQSLAARNALENDGTIRMFAAFDLEEIGSRSAHGADSNMLPSVIRRLSCFSPVRSASAESEQSREHADLTTAYEETLAKSFCISADMSHGYHPNFPAKYDAEHRPEMNAGPVIKIDANACMATDSPAIAIILECAKRAKSTSHPRMSSSATDVDEDEGVPLQWYISRNDLRCGSTYGPMVASLLGTRTIDLGNAQLAMHSIRETCGLHDIDHAINLFESFYACYEELERNVMID